MFCQHCGDKIDEANAKFCRSCGKTLKEQVGSAAEKSSFKPENKRFWSKASLAGGGTALMIMGISSSINDALKQSNIAHIQNKQDYFFPIMVILGLAAGFRVQNAQDGKRLNTFLKYSGASVVIGIFLLLI